MFCDVSAVSEVESDSGCWVLNGLLPSGECFVDSDIKGVPIVQLACDEGMRDNFPGVDLEPFHKFPQHLQGIEA